MGTSRRLSGRRDLASDLREGVVSQFFPLAHGEIAQPAVDCGVLFGSISSNSTPHSENSKAGRRNACRALCRAVRMCSCPCKCGECNFVEGEWVREYQYSNRASLVRQVARGLRTVAKRNFCFAKNENRGLVRLVL